VSEVWVAFVFIGLLFFFLERWAEQKVDLYLRVGLDWVGLG
jgi:hypothetical protein